MAFTDIIHGGVGSIERSALETSIDAITLDDDPTEVNGSAFACGSFRHFTLYLDIDSTATPTTLQIIVQFSDDDGTTWYDHLQGLFASLFYEDTVVASGVKEIFTGDCVGRKMRVRAVGVGTTSSNKFIITAKVEFWS